MVRHGGDHHPGLAKQQSLQAQRALHREPKPFGSDELLARLRAAVRRTGPGPADVPIVRTVHVTVDLTARRVTTPAGEVRLTPTEWHLFELLVRAPGRLISQRTLLHKVWGPAYENEGHYLRVYIA